MTMSNVSNVSSLTHRKDFELGQAQSKLEDEQSVSEQLQKKMKELQVR